MINLFNLFKTKKTVVVALDKNVKLTVEPAVGGGARATLTETVGIFNRSEHCYFATCDELIKSLRLTDEKIVRKLSKAF